MPDPRLISDQSNGGQLFVSPAEAYRIAREGDRYRKALAELVRLKDGPRDDAYRAAKDSAWDAARAVLDESGVSTEENHG